jgi:Na+/H+-dicarboxylate symporter
MRLSTKLGRTGRVVVILALTAVLALLAGCIVRGLTQPGLRFSH